MTIYVKDNHKNERIVQQFAKACRTYDQKAAIQRICANRLGDYLAKKKGQLPRGDLLEIGCGTGFLTEQIVPQFSGRSFYITDLCPKMVERCRHKLSTHPSASHFFSVMDGQKLPEETHFALIVSGLTFHWFDAFKKSVSACIQKLQHKGMLLFSFVEAKSFAEWRYACQELALPYTGNDFPSLSVLKETIRSSSLSLISHLWEEQITLVYPDALSCLRSFKQVGVATLLKDRRLTPFEMRTLLRHWDWQGKGRVALTYSIANAAIQRC